jgi:hypothetical protein
MQIDMREEQFLKPRAEISRSDDRGAKSTRDIERQFVKQQVEISTTVFGMQIDSRAEQFSNADKGRLVILEPGSNVTLKSRVKDSKHSSPIRCTEFGIQIEGKSRKFEKLPSSREGSVRSSRPLSSKKA